MQRTLLLRRLPARLWLCVAMLTTLVWVSHAQQPGAGSGTASQPSSNFTGGPMTALKGEGRISYYIFGPGARTKWHTHQLGQLLLAEEGVGHTQIRGQGVQALRPGQALFSPAGAAHWHGSAPGQSAKMYQVSRGETTWHEEVADKDYNSPPKR
jgi:quercetin dioxygenase-like cupin family protein